MYTRINVVKSRGNAGAAAPKEPNVTIVAVDDILSWPPRDGNGVNIVGSYVMKPNARMITFYMTPASIKAGVESTGDQDAMAFMHKFEGEAPGNDLNLAEAVQNWAGVNCIIIYGSCGEGFRKVQGTQCSPLQLKASLQDDKDARKWKLSFEQFVAVPVLPGHYTGAVVFGEPIAVTDVSPVSINTTVGLIYQLPISETNEEIKLLRASANNGEVITIIGGGGTSPSFLIASTEIDGINSTILLQGNQGWLGLLGSTITLKVFSSFPGYFIEESRS